jgi:hypothetical protein
MASHTPDFGCSDFLLSKYEYVSYLQKLSELVIKEIKLLGLMKIHKKKRD